MSVQVSNFSPLYFTVFLRPGREVALLAGHFRVQPGQRIFRLGMVELVRLFPVHDIVATGAIRPELPLVRILVAADAILRQPEERTRQVLIPDQRAHRGNHVRRRVAFLAGDSRVLIHQRISGQLVIELLLRRIPMDQRKIRAVMFQVAPHAIPAVRILHPQLRVVTCFRRQSPRNFLMAFQTLERRRAGPELVAGSALRRTIQRFVSLGKRPRRNLRLRIAGNEKQPGKHREHGNQQTRRIKAATSAFACVWSPEMHQSPPTNGSNKRTRAVIAAGRRRRHFSVWRHAIRPRPPFIQTTTGGALPPKTLKMCVLIEKLYRSAVRHCP